MITCPVCGQYFTNTQDFGAHYQNTHFGQIIMNINPNTAYANWNAN